MDNWPLDHERPGHAECGLGKWDGAQQLLTPIYGDTWVWITCSPVYKLIRLPYSLYDTQKSISGLLVNLHTVPVGFRDVEALLSIERHRHRPPEIRLGLGRDVIGRIEVQRQGRNEV
jgi:hypothetical protein